MMSTVKAHWRPAGAMFIVLVAFATAACSSASDRTTYAAPTCSELLSAAIAHERSGTGDIDSILQTLSGNCSDEYEIAVDYLSNSTDGAFRIDSCDELIGYGTREESVALLEEDGRCSFGQVDAPADSGWPDGGVGWNQAHEHVGTVQRVCGPITSVRQTDDGTFVNVGLDYPSPDRFTFVFWDFYLDPIESDATVCGSGEIYLYDGVVAQMEMGDPGALEIWR